MFPQRSIRTRFVFQILVASAALLIIFSSILYVYIQQSVYDERKQELVAIALNLTKNQSISSSAFSEENPTIGVSIDMVHIKQKNVPLALGEKRIDNKDYLLLYYPFDFNSGTYLRITKDFTTTRQMLKKILHSIFVINAISFIFIIVYAIAFAKMLISPITSLTERLANMNENFIKPIDLRAMSIEFIPLGESINHLIKRIQTFVKYQKELFIGAAHELKTPLAVIKLKNEVTLIKKREAQEYIEALKTTNEPVDNMNKIVADILNIGRQEGAQFEPPVEIDLIAFLRHKANDFKLIAENEGKALDIRLEPSAYAISIQKTLLHQIIQNFLQNALKFTPKGKKVTLQSHLTSEGLVINVIDEGCGIDESMDIFAPFKRSGDKSGAGLGLFLAKSAADALHAGISIKNRPDGDGAIASLQLNSTLSCLLPAKRSGKQHKTAYAKIPSEGS